MAALHNQSAKVPMSRLAQRSALPCREVVAGLVRGAGAVLVGSPAVGDDGDPLQVLVARAVQRGALFCREVMAGHVELAARDDIDPPDAGVSDAGHGVPLALRQDGAACREVVLAPFQVTGAVCLGVHLGLRLWGW